MGLVQYAAGDTAAAGRSLARGIEISGGYAEACRLLGLAPGEELVVGATEKMSEEEARLLLKSAFGRVPESGAKQPEAAEGKAPTAETQPAVTPGGKPKPASERVQTRVGGVRSGDQMGLEALLYWKE
jgi:hypothetical protein